MCVCDCIYQYNLCVRRGIDGSSDRDHQSRTERAERARVYADYANLHNKTLKFVKGVEGQPYIFIL